MTVLPPPPGDFRPVPASVVRLAADDHGRSTGFVMRRVRRVGHLILLAACGLLRFVAVRYPLWDAKRQTEPDKIKSTVRKPLSTAY